MMWIALLSFTGWLFVRIDAQYATATCAMAPNPSLAPTDPTYQNIRGIVNFVQEVEDGPVNISMSLTGFNTTDEFPSHGWHVHEFGDIAEGCEYAGGHFNPYDTNHGGPADSDRHVGDLGNMVEDASGNVIIQQLDDVIKFDGTADITGRTLDIHVTFDDFGRGNYSDSNSTGHAGSRIACCIIAITGGSIQTSDNAGLPLISNSSIIVVMLLVAFLKNNIIN